MKNEIGTDLSDPKYREVSGVIRLISDLLLRTSVLYYLVTAGLLLPLYLPGYDSLGTDKSLFWIGHLKVSFWIFFASAFLNLVSRIVRQFTDDDAKLQFPSLSRMIRNILPHEIWTVLFGLSICISYALSDNKSIAAMGETNWYVGTWEYLAVCLCILVIGRTRMKGSVFTWITLIASTAVFTAGFIMDIAGDSLKIAGWSANKVSTVGNANWFCGYMVCVLFVPAASYLLRSEKNDTRIINAIHMICFGIGSYIFFSQGSSSAYLALAAAGPVILFFCGRETGKLKRLIQLLMIFSSGGLVHAMAVLLGVYERSNDPVARILGGLPFQIFLFGISAVIMFTFGRYRKCGHSRTGIHIGKCALIITVSVIALYCIVLTVNTLSGGVMGTGPVLYFNDDWASHRGMTISAGLELFGGLTVREKIFGTGPDTFYSLIYSGRFPLLAGKVTDYFGGARLTNAHSEPVTMLVNTGICGTVCFYGMMISLFTEGIGKALHGGTDDSLNASRIVALAAALGIIAYIFNNLLSFQTVMNLSQLSLLAGFGGRAVRDLRGSEDK